MELANLHLCDNMFHCLVLSQVDSGTDSVLNFKIFSRECVFHCNCFRLITGLDNCGGDFSVVSTRPNRLLRRYFPNMDRIKLSGLKRFLQFCSINRPAGFWAKHSDAARLAEVYIVERVLLGRDEQCFVKDNIMKIIDDDVLRVSYPWGTLGFDWLVQSLRCCLRTFKTMSFNSHMTYMINGFPYALHVWAIELFPIFREFSKYNGLKFPRMLRWGPSKQAPYNVVTKNFFHAENRFNRFHVNSIVVMGQERHNYPVALQFAFDSGSCSSSVVLPLPLIDHILDGVMSSVNKKLEDERSTIFKQVTDCLNSRVEELDKRFVDLTKAVAECVEKTTLDSRIDSLETRFVSLIDTIESLVRLHRENKTCLGCGSTKRESDLVDPVNEEGKLDPHLQKYLHQYPENMLCKSTSMTNDPLDILCDAAISTSSQLSSKTQTLSEVEMQIAKEKEEREKLEEIKASIIVDFNDAYARGDYVFSSNEASQNLNEVAADVGVSRKRQRCEDGDKDDDDLPCWTLISSEDTPIEKDLIFGD
ncbi:uncharacterized protein LOC132034513 [Lycium ferocissimum]|uniref:uncharacterized protein LOC132034513 n=1 Tax=Lycium ferocissimum TaxID=112874 RepID=UPI002815D838|nr:uncharacterized protein LOC132034513 [Lycium ferocissimum]